MNHERDLLQELTGRTDPGTVPYAPDPERILQMVHLKTASKKERTVSMSKSKSWKSVLLAAVLIMAIGVCAYAMNGKIISVVSNLSDTPNRTAVPKGCRVCSGLEGKVCERLYFYARVTGVQSVSG